MKKRIFTLLMLLSIIVLFNGLMAQGPPEPPGHGETTNQPPGGSGSLTGGIGILLTLGAAYGGRKLYKAFRQQEQELEE